MGTTLEAKLKTFSVSFGDGASAEEIVVVVPLGGNIQEGFRRAHALAPRRVRLIGHGVTMPGTWPDWVQASSGLILTELGAYRTHTMTEPGRPIRAALLRWTRAIFGSGSIAEALYNPTMLRLLPNIFGRRGIVEAIAARHRDTQLEIVGSTWTDLEQERQTLLAKTDAAREAGRRVAWVPVVGGAWLFALGGTVARQIAGLRASKQTRAAVRTARAERGVEHGGDVWVALIPNLIRINRHVIESVARPAARAGRLRGLLLVDSLADGVHTETKLTREHSTTVWPGVAELLEEYPNLEVDQLVHGETLGEVAADVAATVIASSRAAIRLALAGPRLRESGVHAHDLFGKVFAVATLATMDVARAASAERATRRAGTRRSFHGARVAFCSCAGPSAGAAASMLNRAGATSIDFFHGAGIEDVYVIESPARVHGLWTKLDAEAVESLGRAAFEAGMPVRVQRSGRAPGRRVLILSGYAHRDETAAHNLPFQEELLRTTALAPPGFEFRWRPHPADNPTLIERTSSRYPAVTLSRDTSLEEDVAWGNYILSSISSALIEALFADVPLFVHLPPHYDGLHALSYIAAERAFFRAEDLWPRLLSAHEAISRGEDATLPERRAREMLFGGPGGRPQAFDLDYQTTASATPLASDADSLGSLGFPVASS